MEKDLRRGRGTWRGCHSFDEIFYEGRCRAPQRRRSGGLKMGGTYWYFVRIRQHRRHAQGTFLG